MRSNRGFTFIELVTVMAISVIVLAIGMPSMFDFIASSRASSEYRELTRALGLARSEAITRATDVRLSALTGSNWHQGFRVWVDADNDNTYDSGEALREFSAFASNATLKGTNDVSTLTFTSDGFLDITAGSNLTFSYRTSPERCSRDRNIVLLHTGHVSVGERSCS